jgi:two-component system, cell cycle response regulator
MLVVLADPSRTVQKAVTHLLDLRGHGVRAFADGREALAELQSNPAVDALITSTEPVGLSGFELCWQARLLASARRPIYVIMMSSNREQQVLCEALDSGADDFIGKPPVAEELYARMRAGERLVAMERDLIRLATIDPLTGVLNRRAFFEAAGGATERARNGAPLAAIMMDIDHFKLINDVYGHDCGDLALTAVAQTANLPGSICGRLGGEEFALLLPTRTLAEATAIAEQLRLQISELRVEADAGPMTTTCSFGVSEWEPSDSVDRLLKRADNALYQAKTGGRNRVVVAADADSWIAQPGDPLSVVRWDSRSDGRGRRQ